jgi:hypothetical protein
MFWYQAYFTRAEWDLFKNMPYKFHLALDIANGLIALSAP